MEDKPHFDPQGYTEHEIWVKTLRPGKLAYIVLLDIIHGQDFQK